MNNTQVDFAMKILDMLPTLKILEDLGTSSEIESTWWAAVARGLQEDDFDIEPEPPASIVRDRNRLS